MNRLTEGDVGRGRGRQRGAGGRRRGHGRRRSGGGGGGGGGLSGTTTGQLEIVRFLENEPWLPSRVWVQSDDATRVPLPPGIVTVNE